MFVVQFAGLTLAFFLRRHFRQMKKNGAKCYLLEPIFLKHNCMSLCNVSEYLKVESSISESMLRINLLPISLLVSESEIWQTCQPFSDLKRFDFHRILSLWHSCASYLGRFDLGEFWPTSANQLVYPPIMFLTTLASSTRNTPLPDHNICGY